MCSAKHYGMYFRGIKRTLEGFQHLATHNHHSLFSNVSTLIVRWCAKARSQGREISALAANAGDHMS